MNNTFDIQRFGLLLKRKWLEFGKVYMATLAVAFGVMLIAYTMAFWPLFSSPGARMITDNLFFRVPFFAIFGFLFITAVSSNYFAHLGQKPKTIIDLLIPASTFEKFLAGVFFTSILTTLSFVVLFCLTDLVFVAKFKSTIANINDPAAPNYVSYFFMQRLPRFLSFFYVMPFLISSIFLLGSVYFDKFHYIKTALSVMVFGATWVYIFVKAADYLTSNRHPIGDGGPFGSKPDDNPVLWTLTSVLVILTLVFWVITYVRLKEKEV